MTYQAMKKHSGKSSWPKLDTRRGREKPARSAAAAAIQTWAADRSKLLLGPKISSGSNSRIHRGMYGEQPVAVKIMHAPVGDDDDDVQGRRVVEAQFDAEVSLLSRLRHPNVVRLVAVCREPKVYWVITELMRRGTLSAYLHGREPYSLPPETVIRLALDVARGMEYLHTRGVVHRDLKPENLLLDGGGRVKVADLGTSCLEATCCGDKCSSKAGTFRWMAPEMIHDKRCNRKVDVYSFGLVLWELTTCLVPFQNLSPVQVAYSVCVRDARPPLSPSCPPAINSLIERCWSTEPARRPEFKNIVSVLESYDRCLRQGLPLVPLPEPSPSPLASLLGAFKIRSCKSTTRSSKAGRRVHAYDLC